MQPFGDRLIHAELLHVLRHAGVVVVLLDVRHDRRALPDLGHRIRDPALSRLVAAAIADQNDASETVRLQAVHQIREHHTERFFAHADRTGRRHVSAGRTDVAFGHELHDRRAQRIAQLPRNRVAVGMQDIVVLARDQPRPVRLHTAGGDDRGGFPGLQGVAHVHPGHLFHPHRVGGGERIHGVYAVVRIRGTRATASVAGITLGLVWRSALGADGAAERRGGHGAGQRRTQNRYTQRVAEPSRGAMGGGRENASGHGRASERLNGGSTRGVIHRRMRDDAAESATSPERRARRMRIVLQGA